MPPPTIPSGPTAVFPTTGGLVPPTAIFELHPNIRLSGEYQDNFNRTSNGKTSNFRAIAGPGLRLLVNHPTLNGVVTGNISEAYDTSNQDFSTFYNLSGVLNAFVSPLLVFHLTDTLTKSDQPEAADRLGLRVGRRTFTTNLLSLSADYTFFDVLLRPYYRWSDFSDDNGASTTSHAFGANASRTIFESYTVSLGYEYLDSHSSQITTTTINLQPGNVQGGFPTTGTRGHQVTASVDHRFTASFTGGLSGSYAWRTPQGRGSALQSDFTVSNISAFTSYALGPLTMSGNVGYSQLQRERGRDQSTVSTFSNLTYAFPVGVLSLSADRGFSETFTTGQNFGVVETQGVTIGYSYPLGTNASLYASGFYRENKNTGLTASGIATTVYGASLRAAITILSWLSADAEYRYVQQTGGGGSGDQGNISSNYFQLSLFASF